MVKKCFPNSPQESQIDAQIGDELYWAIFDEPAPMTFNDAAFSPHLTKEQFLERMSVPKRIYTATIIASKDAGIRSKWLSAANVQGNTIRYITLTFFALSFMAMFVLLLIPKFGHQPKLKATPHADSNVAKKCDEPALNISDYQNLIYHCIQQAFPQTDPRQLELAFSPTTNRWISRRGGDPYHLWD